MAMSISTQNAVPPVPQGITPGKHQAKRQEEQKKGEGDAQGRRRGLKRAEGPGRWEGGFGPGAPWFSSGLQICLTSCRDRYLWQGDNWQWPRASLESGFQPQQAGYWSRVWEGDPGRLCKMLKLRAVFAEAVSCCDHICARAAHLPNTFAPLFLTSLLSLWLHMLQCPISKENILTSDQ